MAAVMAAGMSPPLGMALATAVRKQLFTEAERENGLAGWLLGASFITEGAIPFAAADPLRVIPSSMAGSAVTGALVMAFGNELRAPHGGILVASADRLPAAVPRRDRSRNRRHGRYDPPPQGCPKQVPKAEGIPAKDSAEARIPASV